MTGARAPRASAAGEAAAAAQRRCSSVTRQEREMTTVTTGRERSGGAGMDEKGKAAALLAFLGLDRVRLLLPEKLPAAWPKVRRRSWLIPFCLLFYLVASTDALKRRELLASMCDERSRLVQHHFNASMNHLQALAILVSTFHHSKNPSTMDQMTFARYAERTAFEGPLTRGGGVAYAVRVTHAGRELFERQQGWPIKKMYSSEVRGQEEEYAPVIFAQGAYKHVISFDMLSGDEDRANILRARESGKGVLTAPFYLLNNRLGVIMTYTVYKFELPSNARPQERIQAAIGYLGGIFDIEELVDKLLHQLTGNPSIMVNLYDTTSEIPIRMYGSNDTDTDSGLWHVSPLNLGDPSRKHELRCRFTDRPQWPWLAITSSTVTLVIALLIGYISRATIKRNAKYEMNELKKGAEAPMTAESLFLASTTHGIRTATNGVLGMLRMLMDTDLDTTQQDYVRTAQAIAKVLVSLNNAVLDFYHGKLELKTVPFDGRPVCDDTLSLFCGEALEKGIDGYVSKPFEGELSNLAIHLCLEELKQDKIVEKQEEPNLHTRSKFITKFKKLTSACIHSFPSKVYVNKTVVSVGLLGFVLYILAIGIFELPFNQSLGIRSGDGNMTSNNFGHSRGRLLVDTPHGTWANRGVKNNGTISVDLGNMRGNSDSYGQQRHMSSHNSSAIIPAILSNWISNGNPDQSSIHQEETTQIRYRTVKPHLPLPAQKSHKIKLVPWIVLVAVIMLMLVLGIAVWLLLRCNSWKRAPQNELELLGGMEPRRFQLHELAAATSNFTEENRLGQGGFGPVYKGYLSDQDRHVAIKVLSKKQSSQEQSEQGLREFMAEVRVMTQLRHRNVVKLVGWCDSNKRLLLVYELMAQGSLDKHLYDPERILTWQERYKIALDLGSALLYLHRDCEKCVVHGDIKPANVMLDVSHNAKLGDFGLARLIEHGDEPRTTQVVAGTAGYIDPEFINNRWPRTELDVFSFGVVLLEIACGKRPASRHPNGASTLLAWVLHLYDLGLILDAADQRLNAEFDQRQMERVLVTGLWCARQDPMQRPSIVQAMDVLRSADAELPVLPAVVRDARRILSMEEQAYGELPVTDHHVHGVAPSMYFTSKDSGYLLAEE